MKNILDVSKPDTGATDPSEELRESRELLQATLDSSTQMIQVFKAVRNGTGQPGTEIAAKAQG